jgi:RimJ/RimL family protein N-acetyltransferase
MLHTERLSIRAATVADLPTLDRTWLDPQARRFLGGPVDADGLARNRARIDRDEILLVALRDGTVPVGVCALRPYRGDTERSYVFLPEHWGHGYAYEATKALLGWAFATRPELDRTVAVTQTANHRSRYMLRKLGMLPIDAYVEWNEPQTLFAITREAFTVAGEGRG